MSSIIVLDSSDEDEVKKYQIKKRKKKNFKK